ncbi:MAG: acyl carrier protein [Acetobacteraceae bacterium]
MPDHPAQDAEFAIVAAALRSTCGAPLADLAPETHLDELPGMDSLRVLHAVAAIEETFAVEIDVAALDRLRTVGDIVTAVRAARNAAG